MKARSLKNGLDEHGKLRSVVIMPRNTPLRWNGKTFVPKRELAFELETAEEVKLTQLAYPMIIPYVNPIVRLYVGAKLLAEIPTQRDVLVHVNRYDDGRHEIILPDEWTRFRDRRQERVFH